MLFVALSALSLASTATAAVFTVVVGGTSSTQGGIFQYMPATVTAAVGDIVNFQWTNPGNHSVTQSPFATPCQPLPSGFDSGWVNVVAVPQDVPQWNITITNASTPLWFYCKQLQKSPHCDAGMVGAINAPATGNHTFAAFQALAKSNSGASGQGVGNLVGVGASASANPGPLESGVTLFGTPSSGASAATGTASSGSSASGSAAAGAASGTASGSASTSTSTSAASHVAANSFVALVAAALGFTML